MSPNRVDALQRGRAKENGETARSRERVTIKPEVRARSRQINLTDEQPLNDVLSRVVIVRDDELPADERTARHVAYKNASRTRAGSTITREHVVGDDGRTCRLIQRDVTVAVGCSCERKVAVRDLNLRVERRNRKLVRLEDYAVDVVAARRRGRVCQASIRRTCARVL